MGQDMTGALSFARSGDNGAGPKAAQQHVVAGGGGSLPHFAINGRFLCQPVTGVQRVAREVVREIDRLMVEGFLDARVDLFCPEGSQMQGLSLEAIAVHPVGPFQGALWEQFTLPRQTGRAPLLCLGNTAPVPSLLRGEPVGVMIHDLSYLDFGRAYRLSYRLAHRLMLPLLLRRAQRVFVVSQTEELQLRRLAPGIEDRLVIAPNGARFGEVRSVPTTMELPFGAGYGLYVGAFSHRKNFDRVVEVAVRLAREEGRPFVFAGSSPDILRQPRISVPEDVRHLVHFAGQIDEVDRLAALYKGAAYLLFPSLYEASPLPPLEAASFGCPVVASNIASIWERCGAGVEYCDPLRPETIVAAIRRVLAGGPGVRDQVEINRTKAQAASWRRQAMQVCAAMLELCP